MRYSCPSDEEIAAYGLSRGLRMVLDRHASTCPECAGRIRPSRTRFSRRRGLILSCFLTIFACMGLWLGLSRSATPGVGPVAQRPQRIVVEASDASISLNGHVFHGSKAEQIRASFKTSGLRTIHRGDTIGRIARQAYGALNEGIWEALMEYNNHPDNEFRFANRYGRALSVDNLPVGAAIQMPPQQILMLIFHRVEVANATAGR